MRLLLTRPRTDDDQLAAMLLAAGHQLISDPLLSIEALPLAPIALAGLQAIAVTSSNAVRALAPSPAMTRLPLYAVGAATARLARARGFQTIVESDTDARALAGTLASQLDPGLGAVLYLRGEDIAFDLAAALRAANFPVEHRITYRANPADRFSSETGAALAANALDGVVLLSPRTTGVYLRLVKQAGFLDRLARLQHYCLSDRVAEPLLASGLTNASAPARPNLQELVALIGLNATQSTSSA